MKISELRSEELSNRHQKNKYKHKPNVNKTLMKSDLESPPRRLDLQRR